jgi:hypothetical protein
MRDGRPRDRMPQAFTREPFTRKLAVGATTAEIKKAGLLREAGVVLSQTGSGRI